MEGGRHQAGHRLRPRPALHPVCVLGYQKGPKGLPMAGDLSVEVQRLGHVLLRAPTARWQWPHVAVSLGTSLLPSHQPGQPVGPRPSPHPSSSGPSGFLLLLA